ncbi:MAG: ferrous iron transport protein A [Gammaproteobacteria bacterium]|nr:ferrous iron transport protein A [Gammaproteobacteria bacterium]
MAARTLAGLAPGEAGIISGFTVIDGFTQRLMQFGLMEGTEVKVLRRAPTGDPLEVEVMGYALSLRREEADLVLLEIPA